MPRQPLTDEVLADLMPSMTSTILVAFHPRNLRRAGSDEAESFARMSDEVLFGERVLAASDDVPTQRFPRRAQDETTRVVAKQDATKRKPTDSFTLQPETSQRVFDSTPIEVIDPLTGDHLAFVRGQVHRDATGKVVKIQCFLPRGRYLSPPGSRVACNINGERHRACAMASTSRRAQRLEPQLRSGCTSVTSPEPGRVGLSHCSKTKSNQRPTRPSSSTAPRPSAISSPGRWRFR